VKCPPKVEVPWWHGLPDLGCGPGLPGIQEGKCDCNGNVDFGCGCGGARPTGCDNQCGSTKVDEGCGCGVKCPPKVEVPWWHGLPDLGCGPGLPGIQEGKCDCDGNVDFGCGCGGYRPSGCDHQCGSTKVDEGCGCGVKCPPKINLLDGVNGEQYCESDDMMNNEVACKSSSCCHWNTWEEGEASFNGKGRCWSSIGQDICSDTTDVCQLCSRNDCLGNGACLLIEDNGEFTCEIDPLHFTSQSVCDSDYGHWCEKCDGKQLNEEDDESSFNTPLVVGIVGAVVFVAAIAVCIWDQKMRSQKPTPDGHQTGTMVV